MYAFQMVSNASFKFIFLTLRRCAEGRVAAALPAFIEFVERDDRDDVRQGQAQAQAQAQEQEQEQEQGQNANATGISRRRRSVVTLLNQCILSIWKYAGSDPKFVDDIERYVDRDGAFVREYEADMKAGARVHTTQLSLNSSVLPFTTNKKHVFPSVEP